MALNPIGNSGTSPPLPAAPQGAPAATSKAPVVVPEPAQQQQPSTDQVRKAVESMTRMIENTAPNSLQFSIDDDSGKTIVTVTDAQTGEMIRQIPSKELLEIARSLDKLQGLLLQQKA